MDALLLAASRFALWAGPASAQVLCRAWPLHIGSLHWGGGVIPQSLP